MDELIVSPQKWIHWAQAIRHQAEQPSQQFAANLIAPVLTHGQSIVQRLMEDIEEFRTENVSLRAQLPGPSSEPSAAHASTALMVDALIAEMEGKTSTTVASPSVSSSWPMPSHVSGASNHSHIPEAARPPLWYAVTRAPAAHADHIGIYHATYEQITAKFKLTVLPNQKIQQWNGYHFTSHASHALAEENWYTEGHKAAPKVFNLYLEAYLMAPK